MTLKIEDKIELARYRIEKAKRFIQDSSNLLGTKSYESSVNRSYYAVLTASRALLTLRGIDPETHEGVKTMLSKEFIRTGLLPKEFGETFRSIQARRIDSDYGDYIEIGYDEAGDSLKRAEDFVEKAEELLEKAIDEVMKSEDRHN
ncbi:MAG: HEPN domain-containing protein [Deferribacteres bacterium]|nr:HEPN domain-containing protein [Deferribacteres bacterium]